MGLFEDLDSFITSGRATGETAASILATIGTPSTSVAVLDNGSITSHCFSTVGDEADTVFQACSISKPTTGLAVMKLIEQGKFTLESRIVDLLPQDVLDILTEGVGATERTMIEGITIKQLMSHTAGLSQGGFIGYSARFPAPFPSARQVLEGKAPVNSLRVRLNGFPGHAFSYSGGGIVVLQIILETVTGKDFPPLMQELVLAPLGMTRSFYGKLPPDEANYAKPYDTGYTLCEPGQHFLPEQGAAGLWTTPADLLKLVKALQDSLASPSGSGFLQQATAKAILTKVRQDMGLTWFTADTAFGHSGSNAPGYRCIMVGYTGVAADGDDKTGKSENCGLAIMTNSAEGTFAVSKVMDAIAYLKGWPKVTDAIGVGGPFTPFAVPKAAAGSEWKRWAGAWTDGTDTFVLQADDEDKDKPTIRYGSLPAVRLLPAAVPTARSGKGDGFCEFVMEGMELLVRLEEGKPKEEVKPKEEQPKEEVKMTVKIVGERGQGKTVLRRVEAES